jgi:hypothetical protein
MRRQAHAYTWRPLVGERRLYFAFTVSSGPPSGQPTLFWPELWQGLKSIGCVLRNGYFCRLLSLISLSAVFSASLASFELIPSS